jgi:hypothetical protein
MLTSTDGSRAFCSRFPDRSKCRIFNQKAKAYLASNGAALPRIPALKTPHAGRGLGALGSRKFFGQTDSGA